MTFSFVGNGVISIFAKTKSCYPFMLGEEVICVDCFT